MSQDTGSTAVTTAKTSNKNDDKQHKSSGDQICIIIGDMLQDHHNMHAVNQFLQHGYNVIILYSNIDSTNEQEIGSLFDNKFKDQLLEIKGIDLKSIENINKVFSELALLKMDKWTHFQISVFIYNGALSLSNLMSNEAGKDEQDSKENKDNKKSGLTFKEIEHCHDIGASAFIHSVKHGLKFIDKQSQKYFHVFYGTPTCDNNSELMKTINEVSKYGKSLVNQHISDHNGHIASKIKTEIFLHSMLVAKNYIINANPPRNSYDYICKIIKSETDTDAIFLDWATVAWRCNLYTTIDDVNYYLDPSNVGTNTEIALTTDSPSTEGDWIIGANNTISQYSRNLCIGHVTENDGSKGLSLDYDSSDNDYILYGNSSSVNTSYRYELWRFEPILKGETADDSTYANFGKEFKLINVGRWKALSYETNDDKSATSRYKVAAGNNILSSAVWAIDIKSAYTTSTADAAKRLNTRLSASEKKADENENNGTSGALPPREFLEDGDLEMFLTCIGECKFGGEDFVFDDKKTFKQFNNVSLAIERGFGLINMKKIKGFMVDRSGKLYGKKTMTSVESVGGNNNANGLVTYIGTREPSTNYLFQIGVDYDGFNDGPVKDGITLNQVLDGLQANASSSKLDAPRSAVFSTSANGKTTTVSYKNYQVPWNQSQVIKSRNNSKSVFVTYFG